MSSGRAAGAAPKRLRYLCLQCDWAWGQRISRKGLVLRRMEFTVWDESRSRALKFFPYAFRGGTPRPKFGSLERGDTPEYLQQTSSQRTGSIPLKLDWAYSNSPADRISSPLRGPEPGFWNPDQKFQSPGAVGFSHDSWARRRRRPEMVKVFLPSI